ncbi:hypothetical protein C8T65DRAFT_627495 [Cerioporus squamosus]|nr:hypothetical protein C8T65DRAFT_627495 [Cerioporus squamosus]
MRHARARSVLSPHSEVRTDDSDNRFVDMLVSGVLGSSHRGVVVGTTAQLHSHNGSQTAYLLRASASGLGARSVTISGL